MTKKTMILLLKPLRQRGWGKEQTQKKECSKADRLEKVSHNPFPSQQEMQVLEIP